MKILVFSDSHGYMASMEQAVRREKPDQILHLGDCLPDARGLIPLGIPVLSVPGNCDWGSRDPAVLTPEFEGVRVYMTHGHLHNVKVHYQRILYAALEAEARVCLFGHTHRAECFRDPRGLWVMNPGACGPRGSYGVLTIGDGEARCQLKSVK